MHHAEPTNPHTGEAEDVDVGFPGAEHHIAEREWPMRAAMAVLGFGALFAGLIQVPGVDHVITTFLEGTFESSTLYHQEPSTADSWLGLAVGGAISIIGIGFAYLCYVRRPGVTVRLAERFRRLHGFLLNKWYFDELHRRARLPAGDRDRALLQLGLRAGRGRRDRRRRDRRGRRAPARSSAAPSRASSAPTRCCWSAASPRSASTSWW